MQLLAVTDDTFTRIKYQCVQSAHLYCASLSLSNRASRSSVIVRRRLFGLMVMLICFVIVIPMLTNKHSG